MPISRKEFEKGELDPGFVIEEFLRSNADLAYTADELVVELASSRIALKVGEMEGLLGDLEKRGRVSENRVRDVVYYIYHKPISPRPS